NCPCSSEGVSLDSKKVVMNSDVFEMEHFSPNAAKHFLSCCPWLDIIVPVLCFWWTWQVFPIHFSVRRQRQLLQPHIRYRHHVLRQLLRQMPPQLLRSHSSFSSFFFSLLFPLLRVVGHQPLLSFSSLF